MHHTRAPKAEAPSLEAEATRPLEGLEPILESAKLLSEMLLGPPWSIDSSVSTALKTHH